MCGICGIIGTSPPAIATGVHAMMDAMVHRGPNDAGYEVLNLGSDEGGPSAGFGFRRLAILDLTAAGHQPMFNAATGDCLIFNGEIYNFRRLRTELQCEGVVFHSHSDTEVLLHAIGRWGEHALQKIQGMYALAFYDARTRRILLARDPLGIKPLYVANTSRGLAFASEIRALRASGIPGSDLDVDGVTGMLAYGAVPSPYTIYRDIRSFPAGHYQWISAGSMSSGVTAAPRRFWSYPPTADGSVDLPTAAAKVRLLLHDAVLRHLVADVPVGVFLSAGIDSTIIASYAREYTPHVTAFTVGFGAVHGEDEIQQASQTARVLGMRHVCVSLDIRNMPEQWHDWISSMDSPSVDGFNTYVVSRRLAEENVVVGLSGLGADEFFGGYPSFRTAPRLASLVRALQFVPGPLRGDLVRTAGALSRRTGAFEKLADLVSGEPTVPAIALAMRRTLSDHALESLGLSGGRARSIPGDQFAGADPFQGVDAFNSVSRVETHHYMGDMLLRDTDANSMRHSLEVRVPFLDLPLVDYVSSLPGRVKRSPRGLPKYLLRAACQKVLRDDIARRPKTGFSLPIGDWMRHAMRESCEAAIDRLANVPFLDQAAIRHTWNTFVQNPESLRWSRPLALVVLGASIE
jgi:asparagine synthase (glutamine-hydrolysing)